MKIKTAELIGPALDWAVAMAEGATGLWYDTVAAWWFVLDGNDRTLSKGWSAAHRFNPSTDWSCAGPIVEREGIDWHQIKSRPYSLFEFNNERWKRESQRGGEIVMRVLSCGPGRYIKAKKTPGKNGGKWVARMSVDLHPFGWKETDFLSETPLIAAMRCYVTEKLGKEVEIPDELAP